MAHAASRAKGLLLTLMSVVAASSPLRHCAGHSQGLVWLQMNSKAQLRQHQATLARKVSEIFAGIDSDFSAHELPEGEYAACFGQHRTNAKLTIISLVSGLPADFVKALRGNRLEEADKYGYEYCEYRTSLDKNRDVAWSKLLAIQDLFDKNRSMVAWMDADAYFVSIKAFERIVQEHIDAGKDAVFTDDINGGQLNTGFMVLKNSPWSNQFLHAIYDDYTDAIKDPFWEQRAALDFLRDRPVEFHTHAAIVPHHLMNNVASSTGKRDVLSSTLLKLLNSSITDDRNLFGLVDAINSTNYLNLSGETEIKAKGNTSYGNLTEIVKADIEQFSPPSRPTITTSNSTSTNTTTGEPDEVPDPTVPSITVTIVNEGDDGSDANQTGQRKEELGHRGSLLFSYLAHSAHSAKLGSDQQTRAEQAIQASRAFYTYSEEPTWLSSRVRDMFNVSSRHETSLLGIKTDADIIKGSDDEAVQIYYSNGFFGSMSRGDFSQQCGIPCVRAAFPNGHAAETADAFMVFPIDNMPPRNKRGAVALGHTGEAIALYGGQNAHNYDAMADMNWRSTVPWTYFDPINIRKKLSHQILSSASWEARKPAAVFVARNCGGNDRNSLISQLIAHGIEVDSISSCKPGGSHGSWPADVPHSNKMGALQKYRVYLALENRKEEGYVTEKVADGLMSGATTVYLGAPDIDNYVPDTALINANNYNQDMERIVSQIKKAISDKTTWEGHRSWLKQSPESWNNGKILKAFSYSDGKPAECRLCRYAYSKRMGLGWDWSKQQPAKGSVPPNGDKFWKTWPSVKHA